VLQRAALLLFFLSFIGVANAQSNKADILGTVKDANGSVVPGATVTITKTDTGAERVVSTNDQGEYNAPLLDIGTYKVVVAKQGYGTVVRPEINLQTNDRLRVDLELKPGEVSAEVTITAEASLVESDTSVRGGVVTGREVTELPLSGRNFTQLATLMPGVAAANNTGFGGTRSRCASI
jgi:hypothetical protein